MSVEGKLIDRNLFFESAQSAKWRVLRVTKRRKVSRFAVFFPPSDFVRGHERRKKREWTRNLRNTNNLCCCCVCIMDFCPFSWRFLTYSLSLFLTVSVSRLKNPSKIKVESKGEKVYVCLKPRKVSCFSNDEGDQNWQRKLLLLWRLLELPQQLRQK